MEIDASSTPTNNEDTEMGEGSMANSDDDEGDEGEEGDDGDDDEGSDAQNSPSKRPRTTSPLVPEIPALKSSPNFGPSDVTMGGTELPRPSKIVTERERSEGKSGSPLKTVALTASTLTSPLMSPSIASVEGSFSVPGHQSPLAASAEAASLNETMQREALDSAPTTLPPPPPEPTETEVDTAVETRNEEEEEEEMLLDIVDNANNAQIGGRETPLPAPKPEIPAEAITSEAVELPREEENMAEPSVEEKKPEEPVPEADDDDYYPDLLGDLEKSLEKQEVKPDKLDVADTKETEVAPVEES